MKRLFALFLVLFFIGCDEIIFINQNEDYIYEFQKILKGYEKEGLNSPVKANMQLPEPIKTENEVKFYNEPVAVAVTTTGANVSVEIKLNGVVHTGSSITISEDGVYYILVKAVDTLGRSAYCGEKVCIDKTSPVIKFVNTNDSFILADIDNFVDNVPDNAIEDNSSGVDISSMKAWWKDNITPNSVGVWYRCYSVCDLLGNESEVFEHPVTFCELVRGNYGLSLVKSYDFDQKPSGSEITFIQNDFSFGSGYMSFSGADKVDKDFKVDVSKIGKFDYIEISVKWNSTSYSPNFYINKLGTVNGAFVFLKAAANPPTAFLKNDWSNGNGYGGLNPNINRNGEDNIIGFLEAPNGGFLYFNGDSRFVEFERVHSLFNGEVRFGFNNDTPANGLTVYVDYIRFYSVVSGN